MFGISGLGTDDDLRILSECCLVNPKKPSGMDDGYLCSFIPMAAVGEHGEFDSSETRTYQQVRKGFSGFIEGDVLFAKINPCMQNGKGAIAQGLKNGIGFGSTEFHVLRPNPTQCNSAWLYTLLSFPSFRIDAEKNMTGSAGQRRVPASYLKNYKVKIPPLSLQQEFANFVHQVDKLKFETQQSIEKLQTLYDSLAQEYFAPEGD